MFNFVKKYLFVIGFLISNSAFCFESQFSVDQSVNLAELSKKGVPIVRTVREGDVFRSDASAILKNIDVQKLFQVSQQYEKYKQFGVPYIVEGKILDRIGPYLYSWVHMSHLGQVTKQYLEVRVHTEINRSPKDFGIEWQLAHKRNDWNHPEVNTFKRHEGSWYILPVGPNAAYVRYYLVGVIDTFVPSFIIELIMKDQFGSGVVQVIQALEKQAKIR